MEKETTWIVYVIQSQQVRVGKTGKELPGQHYVGCTTNIERRLMEQ